MNDRIRKAFEQVQAESELKNKTKDFIRQKTNGYQKAKRICHKRLVHMFACIAPLLIGGYWLYFTPTVEISIDVNPSIELGVNRFNRIISLESYNEDGEKLLGSLDIKFRDYSEAVNQIMESEEIISLLSNDEVMTIAVIGTDSVQSGKILATLQLCTEGRKNTYCYSVRAEEVKSAHEAGLSYGKYRAYLELQVLDPAVTVQNVQSMTMREIRDQIHELSSDGENETDSFENRNGHPEKGNRQGQKNKEENRQCMAKPIKPVISQDERLSVHVLPLTALSAFAERESGRVNKMLPDARPERCFPVA